MEIDALAGVRERAARCRNCDLWKRATQTVFGEGATSARIMLVGEQPGYEEDREGRPFVGPAGRVLNRALEEAGIDDALVYVTNAVKHFKWVEGRGDKPLHKKPNVGEIMSCRPWLEAEIRFVGPEVIVCMGTTAARSLLGTGVAVLRDRGKRLESPHAPAVTVTVHPSSILRQQTDDKRHLARAALAADLRLAAGWLR